MADTPTLQRLLEADESRDPSPCEYYSAVVSEIRLLQDEVRLLGQVLETMAEHMGIDLDSLEVHYPTNTGPVSVSSVSSTNTTGWGIIDEPPYARPARTMVW